MKKSLSILCLAISALSMSLSAQTLKTYVNKVPDGYNFWLSTPKSSASASAPAEEVAVTTPAAAPAAKPATKPTEVPPPPARKPTAEKAQVPPPPQRPLGQRGAVPKSRTHAIAQPAPAQHATAQAPAPKPQTKAQAKAQAKNGKKPLIIFLHGASLCGNDLNKVRRYGTLDAISRGLNIDAYVIAPQNPRGPWKPKNIMNIVDYVIKNNPDIDTTRVYALGMSLGGYGTMDLAAEYPGRIAAAMALCGGGTSKNQANLNKVPLWIAHGTADRAVAVRESDKVVENMRAADPKTPRLIYDRIAGANHSQLARFFYMPEVYRWLFSHSLTDPDRKRNKGFPVSVQSLGGAYDSLRQPHSVTVGNSAP